MIQMPKVSIYIPVYNYEIYVEKAIESVIRQTFKDWELIVINDGSSDNTEKVLRKYEAHLQISVVNQSNKGLPVTCNIALRLAKGKYIMRLDGDDYLDENALLVMTNFLEDHPEIGLVYPDYYLVDENNEIISIERRERINHGEDCLLDLPPHGACTMFRRRILLELGGYDEEIDCQDGYDIWFRFIESYKPDNINLPLFYYRQHNASLTKNHRKILDTRQVIKQKYAELKRKRKNWNQVKRVAIIPVRGDSDVMKRLALSEIAGQPMINYTIDEAIRSDCFNRIVVTCEDDSIIRYVEENYPELTTFKRPMEFARRNTGLEGTVQFTQEYLKSEFDEEYEEIMLLFSQAPLKRAEHFIKAIDTLHIFETDCVISLCETNSPYYVRDKDSLKRIGNTERFRLERKNIYEGNGALLVFKASNLITQGGFGNRIGHIIMLREDSVNICTKFDYYLVEWLIDKRRKSEDAFEIK